MSKQLYKQIPDGQQAVIVYPNLMAMLTGIAIVTQTNTGEITVTGTNGNKWVLQNTGIDIQAEHHGEAENAMAYKLMPLCH